MERNVVCGMQVDSKNAACQSKTFTANPEQREDLTLLKNDPARAFEQAFCRAKGRHSNARAARARLTGQGHPRGDG